MTSETDRAAIAEAEALRLALRQRDRNPADHWPNLVQMFEAQAARLGDRPMLYHRDEEGWQPIAWREVAARVRALARALIHRGVSPGDRVMIVSENRPEFLIADFAIMAAGAIPVPTYTTNSVRDHAHILEDSGAVAAIVSTAKLARTLMEAIYQAGHCRTLITMEPSRTGQTGDLTVCHFGGLIDEHRGDETPLDAVHRLRRDDLACIIYTSGTGGLPRGVKQHHGALLHNVGGCIDIIEQDFGGGDQERFLSFLPLSHAYEHTAGQMLPIALGGEIWYSEGLDRLAANIEEVQPTIMVVVPRLFEVLRQRMLKAIAKQGGMAPRLLAAAGRLEERRRLNGGLRLIDRPLDWLLDRTLRRRIAQRFGGRLKAMVSGGAPLNPEVGQFFASVGVTILQGYGQTEAGPVISCNRPAAGIKLHSVGPPLRRTEVRIADDGEILVSGELVMPGYWRQEEETAKSLVDGWLHTGDIGIIDEDGHLVITDRKRDIIVNDKGENVSPQKVEGMLTLEAEIGQAYVQGDRRPHLVGVVVPDAEFAMQWAAEKGVDVHEVARDRDFVRAVHAAVDRVNQQLAPAEKVRRVLLADEPFSIENEQLTPSLKIRRHKLREVYGPRLAQLYRA